MNFLSTRQGYSKCAMIKEVEAKKEHPMKGVVGALTEENLVNLQLQEPVWGPLEPSIDDLGCFMSLFS